MARNLRTRPDPARATSRREQYDSSMSHKVRKTLTLDPDVVDAFGDDSAALSATVNSILRREMHRRTRRAALEAFVASLDAAFGEPDPGDVERFRRALE